MDMRPVKQVITDWSNGVKDRVDNLCAIYKCDDIHAVASIVMSADSIIWGMYKMLVHTSCIAAEADPEAAHIKEFITKQMSNIVAESLSSIMEQSVELLCVDDADALADDLMRIVQSRYALEDALLARMGDEEDDDDE